MVTAPVTAATAFLLRDTGLRGAPWPKLERRLPIPGCSREVAAIEGNASGSFMSSLLDEEAQLDADAIFACF